MHCMKRFALLLAAVSLAAQVNLSTIADITGDGSAHKISSTAIAARWVQIIAPAGNSAVVRIGDVNTSNTRGASVAAGGGFMLPPSATSPQNYDLSKIYYYAANGDKLTVTYAQ